MAQPIIEVRNLSKKYVSVTAVRDISFTVQKGEIFAFLGPNGAGKTTTIQMLTTLREPTTGFIRLNGFDPILQKNETRSSFGIVFQDPSLDDELTAWENMEYHGVLYHVAYDVRQKRIEELLSLVDLGDRTNSLVKTFSGGMKRRLEIARGLLHHPKILFLDEPTLGLDVQTRNLIWQYVQSLNDTEQITVFFTTHYIEEAEKVADRVAVIDHGSIIATGTPAELMKKADVTTLESAFLVLTGSAIRNESADPLGRMRMWRGR